MHECIPIFLFVSILLCILLVGTCISYKFLNTADSDIDIHHVIVVVGGIAVFLLVYGQ